MAPKSVARRLADSYLSELLEHDLLPEITCEDGGSIPTADVVERILGDGALSIERKRTREHGEVLIVVFPLEPSNVGSTGADVAPG